MRPGARKTCSAGHSRPVIQGSLAAHNGGSACVLQYSFRHSASHYSWDHLEADLRPLSAVRTGLMEARRSLVGVLAEAAFQRRPGHIMLELARDMRHFRAFRRRAHRYIHAA